MEKRLFKGKNRVLCGVCSGIGEYFNVDPTLIRLITIVLTLCSVGLGLVGYIIAAVIIPEQEKTE